MDENNKNNSKDFYEYLTGYFPKKYDMMPDELLKAIDTETKKRDIALGMITPKEERLAKQKETAVGEQSDTDIIKEADEKPAFDSAPVTEESVPEPEKTALESAPEATVTEVPEKSEIQIVYEPEVSDDDLEEFSAEENEVEFENLQSDDAEESTQFSDLFALFEEENENTESSGNVAAETEFDDDDPSELKMRKTVNWFFDFLEVFAMCMAAIILVFSFVARLTKVDGLSMNDTLSDSDYLIVSNLFYTPEPGDIVVVQNTSLEVERLREPLVKRVIAVAGQTVNIDSSGTVTITYKDGTEKTLDEPYAKYEYGYTRTTVDNVYVPEGYIFVAGDNRDHSTDSRRPEIGLIDIRCVFGKAILRALPVSDFTLFENPFKN